MVKHYFQPGLKKSFYLLKRLASHVAKFQSAISFQKISKTYGILNKEKDYRNVK